MATNFIHHVQYKKLLTITLTVQYLHHPLLFIISIRFWSHVNRSFTHLTPSPPHPKPTPLPHSHHLLSNYIQHYTGGSWVRRQTWASGEWFKSCFGPLTLLLLLLLSPPSPPPATACWMSACHVCLLSCCSYLSCLFSIWSSSVGTRLFGVGFWGFIAMTNLLSVNRVYNMYHGY